MKKKRLQKRHKKYPWFVLVGLSLVLLLVGFGFYQSSFISSRKEVPSISPTIAPVRQEKTYTSKVLGISFSYPKEWYVTDIGYRAIITNYSFTTSIDYRPNNNELEIQISEYSLCQATLDQDIVFWGCGEGEQVANVILEKKTKELSDGILFSDYLIFYPQSNIRQRQYYLQKGDRILQIDKAPDPSRFEKEFEEIINSIVF